VVRVLICRSHRRQRSEADRLGATMPDMARSVTCLDCGYLIETPPVEPSHPQPCPQCGSLSRRVSGIATAVLGFTATAKGEAFDATVVAITDDVGPTDEVEVTVEKQPKMTDVGVATHSCEFRMTPTTDDPPAYYVEVVRDEEVVASGMGDNLVDALLGVIEFMLPPDHPEYPKD
jgi:hypothetical protein